MGRAHVEEDTLGAHFGDGQIGRPRRAPRRLGSAGVESRARGTRRVVVVELELGHEATRGAAAGAAGRRMEVKW